MRKLNIEKQDLSRADTLLIEKTIAGVAWRYKDFSEENTVKVEYELNTIINMGFSDYLLIVQDLLDVGRRAGYMPDERLEYLREHVYEMTIPEMNAYINADQSYPGMTTGPGRGSAAGSIVTYALGITSVDPIANGLLFERFLNPERVSMPDIDSDFSKSEYEYGVRDIVIEYTTKKYGKNAVCGITIPSTLKVKAAIKNVARIMGAKKAAENNCDKDATNKIMKEYYRYGDRINNLVPSDPNAAFDMKMNPEDPESVTLLQMLESTFQNEPILLDIIHIAKRVEFLNVNFGMHACGKIVYPGDIRECSSLMKHPATGIWNLQMDSVEAEKSGLLKIDFLGLRNLNLITKAARLVYKNHGIKLDLTNLPEDPAVYREIFSKGYTRAVFQFESDGMRSMLKRFEPEKFSDLVLLVASYRPGPMQYLKGIIQRKHGRKSEEDSAVMHIPQIADVVAPTYFAIVYQEQVQQIFRQLAGYSFGQADLVRRAMSKKKEKELKKERQAFLYGDPERNIPGCEANGIDVAMADRLYDEMMDFARYAFNKSHAAAYAVVAYITAYLKYHFPTEFYIAALEFSNNEKYQALIAEAKELGVTVYGPDIERSKRSFSGKNMEIYFGFSGIKGFGSTFIEEGRSYQSFSDFILDTELSEKTVSLLVEAGAFDRKVKNRKALLAVMSEYYAQKDVIKKKTTEIQKFELMLNDLDAGIPLDRKKYAITTKSLPTAEKLRDKIAAHKESIRDAKSEIREVVIPCEQVIEDVEARLERELELIGMYASGHPLDPYGTPKEHGCTPITDLDVPEDRFTTDRIFGKVTDLRHTVTKKNSEDMCFFKLIDQTGEMDVCCFPKSYRLCGEQIKEGAILILSGKKAVKSRGADEDTYQFILDNSVGAAERVYDKKGSIVLPIHGIDEWPILYNNVIGFTVISGHPLMVYDETTGAMYKTTLRVSDGLTKNPLYHAKLIS